MSKVRGYMSSVVITVDEDATVKQACQMMNEEGVSGLFVTSESGETGVFTDTDLLLLLSRGKPTDTKLKEVTSRDIFYVSPEASIKEAAEFIKANGVSRLFVSNNNSSGEKPEGIISVTDIIRALRDRLNFK